MTRFLIEQKSNNTYIVLIKQDGNVLGDKGFFVVVFCNILGYNRIRGPPVLV